MCRFFRGTLQTNEPMVPSSAVAIVVQLLRQSMRRAISIADRIYLMRSGRVVAEGHAEDFAGRTDLEQVYFGGGAPP